MTSQKRNPEMVNLLRPDFFARNEPNASWVHFPSAIMQLCALKGYWPLSSLHFQTPNIYACDICAGHNLELINTPTLGYLESATLTALPPWINFVAANSQYLSHITDDSQHDITGTEAYIAANERGLTCGGWFKFTTAPASVFGLISKWYNVANQFAYVLAKDAGNNIIFEVSTDGTAGGSSTVTSAGTVTTGQWYFLVGRFDPSTTLDVFVDNVKTTNAVAIPASIFDSNEPLQIGRASRTYYLDGKASNCFLTASMLSDAIIEALWENSRVMYGK